LIGKRIAITLLQIILLFLGLTFALLTNFGYLEFLLQYSSGADFVPAILALLLLLLLIIEIISWLNISDSTIHTVLLAAAIFFRYIFSLDMQNIYTFFGIPTSEIINEVFNFFFFMGIALSELYFINYAYKTNLSDRFATFSIIVAVICLFLYIGLEFVNLQYVAFLCYLVSFGIAVVKIYSRTFKLNNDDSTFYLTMTIIYATISMQICSELYAAKLINFVPLGYSSAHIFLIIGLFVGVYICFIVRTSREACKASEYKLQMEKLKTTVLREQINPHFIFNSLTAVKSLYHQDVEKGDYAMNLFSKHLRTNVEAIDRDLIPFEHELDNIANYVELQNLKSTQQFNIIYDIAISNFYVPILSLQVFVENAIKYSKVNYKDDGYIEISSYEDSDEIIIEVNDNGVGFDTNQIKDQSYGIKNSRERFALLMNSNIDITSSTGEGTKVKIHIDKKYKFDEGENENYCS
jgi:sensor histidine kinase YesM